MAGTNIEQYEGRGINYRALDDLFALNAKRQGEVSQPHLLCLQACREPQHAMQMSSLGFLVKMLTWAEALPIMCST